MMKARHSDQVTRKRRMELFTLITALKNVRETEELLQDLLTPQELDSLAERWQEVQLLAAGMSQRDIAKELGISISKITRGSRVLQFGTGGFAKMIKKLKNRSNN